MSVELATAYVSLVPSLKPGSLNAAGDEAGKSFAGRFSKAAKVGLAVGAGGVLAGLGAIIKTGFGETKDASAGTAQLAAGIKSTGNAAHVSVKGLNDLAGSIQGYSGQTDDSIVKAEQLLLTFTNIKNNGPDKIFDQATVAASDMAAKMGGDASSNAILLGKALNDPVKGISALTRVGVSFTAGQKKQVAQMVKTGDTVGAQKLILHELNTEFGGAAKAAGKSLPGQMARAKRSFEDVSQSIVTAALPVITKFFGFIQTYAIPAIGKLFNVVKDHWPQIRTIGLAVFGAVKTVLTVVADFIKTKVIPAVQTVVAWIVAHWPQIKNVFAAVWDFIKPLLVAFGNLLKTIWTTVLMPIVGWIQTHWPQIKTVMLIVFAAIGVAVLVVKTVLIVAFNIIGAAIRVMAAVFKWQWEHIISPAYTGIKVGIGIVRDVVSSVSTAVSTAFKGAGTGLKWAWDHVISPVFRWIKNGIAAVDTVIEPIITTISNAFRGIGDGLKWAWDHTVGTVFGWIQDALGAIRDAYNALFGDSPTSDAGKKAAGNAGAGQSGGQGHGGTPHKAMGGPVKAHQPYIVGEHRPELFVPETNGRIVPRVPSGGWSKSVNIVQNFYNTVQKTTAAAGPDGMTRAAYAIAGAGI